MLLVDLPCGFLWRQPDNSYAVLELGDWPYELQMTRRSDTGELLAAWQCLSRWLAPAHVGVC